MTPSCWWKSRRWPLISSGRLRSPKTLANWISGELFRLLNQAGQGIEAAPVSPARLAELAGLVAAGTLNLNTAKNVLEHMYRTGRAASEIVAEQGLGQVSDAGAIEAVVAEVIAANPGELATYLGGKATVEQ